MSYEAVFKTFVSIMDPIVAQLESLSWIGHATHVVKLPFLDNALQPVSNSIGMELTILKYTLGMFAVYPFSAVLYNLPNKNLKHFFSFIIGIFLVQWIYGADWIHSFISSAVTYLLCAIVPKKYAASIVFLWAMGYMTGSHVYRMYVSYMSGIFDFTGTQMVLTMKLTSFAYNLYDGTYDHKRVFATDHAPKDAKLYAQRKKYAITSLPNPLEFFGYIYCFTCILAGPAFEYNDYAHSIDETAFIVKKDAEDKNGKVKKPSTILPSLTCLLIGVVSMVGYMQIAGRYPVTDQYKPSFIAAHPILPRFGLLLFAMFGERLKYYFAWKIAEGASILGGFGFEGYTNDGKVKGWSGVENIDILGFELAANVQMASRAWNKRTQGWLERYTYARAGKSLLATYFVSALWHGLYPGFFVVFLTIPIMTNVERLCKSKINPIFAPGYDGFKNETYPNTFSAKAYWFVCWICTLFCMNYVVQAFTMGSLENCLRAYGSYKYILHGVLLLVYVILTVLPSKKEKKEKSADDKKKE